MAKKTKTQAERVLAAVKTRKNGISDEDLIYKTGIVHAATIRSHMTKEGILVQRGNTTNGNGRKVKTWGLA
jgi:hypothetical protein